jgi:putative transcriptional regulator
MNTQLRAERRKADLSQQQLGDKVGLSRQAINIIERGRSFPSLTHAMRLARVFNTSVEDLFGKDFP